MSTKTTFKRIALVAVAALGLGVLTSVAPATAGATPTFNAVSGALSVGGTAATAPTAKAVLNAYVIDSVTAGTADSVYTITSTGVGQLSLATPSATNPSQATANLPTIDANPGNYIINSATSVTWYAGAYPGASAFTDGVIRFAATSAVEGTQTITITGNGGGSIKQVITWITSPVVSATTSSVLNTTASGFLSGNIDTVQAVAAPTSNATLLLDRSVGASYTARAAVYVLLKDNSSAAGAVVNSTPVTLTITGPGLVDGYTAANNTTGSAAFNGTPAKSATAVTNPSTGVAVFRLSGDGTSGASSMEIAYTNPATGVKTVLATRTAAYYSTTVATVAVSQSLSVGVAGTATTLGASDGAGSGAFTVDLKDSSGNPVPGRSAGSSTSAGIFVTSDNTACISSSIGTVTAGDSAAGNLAVGTYDVNLSTVTNSVSGCTANVTVSYYNSATSTIVSTTPMKFSTGGTKIVKLALTTDNTTYTPGDQITYTLTATDSAGKPVADGNYGVFNGKDSTSAIAGLSVNAPGVGSSAPFSKAAPVSPATNNTVFVGGVSTSKVFAPYVDGVVTSSFTTSATSASLDSTIQGTKLTATYTTTGTVGSAQAQAAADAAAEATDAANAATDAANAAAEAADAATAAAQDAADAVAALSTQVSEMMAAMKKQITALTNIIVKIQKKVKA
jgi:hypothetical protein